jgi:hypothetical protein
LREEVDELGELLVEPPFLCPGFLPLTTRAPWPAIELAGVE